MNKTRRQHELCSGNAGKQGLKYFFAWEQGKAGANAPEKPATRKDISTGFAKPADHISTIGTVLEKIISERGGKISCGQCRWEVRRLNMMTKSEATARREELAAKIAESARSKSPKLYQRIAARVDHLISSKTPIPSLVNKMVLEWVDEAIEKGEIFSRRKTSGIANVRGGKVSNSPTIPDEPLPFSGPPRLTLMFHVWPHGEGWKRHIEKLAPIIPKCNRLLLGVATDRSTYSLEETIEAFGDQWEVFHADNKPSGAGKGGLREVATYSQMLPTISSGQDDITLCLHGKGSQGHTVNEVINWWTDAMYETVAYNIDEVVSEMSKGAAIVGSFRRHGRHLGTKHQWHYTGSFYALRNAIAFSNGHPSYRRIWWGTESFPGDHFPLKSSACLFGDHVNDMYKREQQPRKKLVEWRNKRKPNEPTK